MQKKSIGWALTACLVQLTAVFSPLCSGGHGDYSTPEVDDSTNIKGMNTMLGVEEQASMCDLNVTTPYSEVVRSEDEETLQDKTDI